MNAHPGTFPLVMRQAPPRKPRDGNKLETKAKGDQRKKGKDGKMSRSKVQHRDDSIIGISDGDAGSAEIIRIPTPTTTTTTATITARATLPGARGMRPLPRPFFATSTTASTASMHMEDRIERRRWDSRIRETTTTATTAGATTTTTTTTTTTATPPADAGTHKAMAAVQDSASGLTTTTTSTTTTTATTTMAPPPQRPKDRRRSSVPLSTIKKAINPSSSSSGSARQVRLLVLH